MKLRLRSTWQAFSADAASTTRYCFAPEGKALVATSSDGARLWSLRGDLPVSPENERPLLHEPVKLAVSGGDAIYCLTLSGEIHAFDLNGNPRWSIEVPAAAVGRLFVRVVRGERCRDAAELGERDACEEARASQTVPFGQDHLSEQFHSSEKRHQHQRHELLVIARQQGVLRVLRFCEDGELIGRRTLEGKRALVEPTGDYAWTRDNGAVAALPLDDYEVYRFAVEGTGRMDARRDLCLAASGARVHKLQAGVGELWCVAADELGSEGRKGETLGRPLLLPVKHDASTRDSTTMPRSRASDERCDQDAGATAMRTAIVGVVGGTSGALYWLRDDGTGRADRTGSCNDAAEEAGERGEPASGAEGISPDAAYVPAAFAIAIAHASSVALYDRKGNQLHRARLEGVPKHTTLTVRAAGQHVLVAGGSRGWLFRVV